MTAPEMAHDTAYTAGDAAELAETTAPPEVRTPTLAEVAELAEAAGEQADRDIAHDRAARDQAIEATLAYSEAWNRDYDAAEAARREAADRARNSRADDGSARIGDRVAAYLARRAAARTEAAA